MSNITLDEWAPLLSREAVARRGTLLTMFAVVALLFLIVAWFWQKKYTSYVQIHVDSQNAVQVVAGVETALDTNQANVARETLFSTDIMETVLDDVGYVDADSSPVERERIKEELMKDTQIFNINNQLLEIVVEHSDPEMAYKTADRYGDLFLAKSMATSSLETSEAFDFIVNQVETYRTKLEDADARLESFRKQYPGISVATEGNVDSRIVELRREKEEAGLQYAEFNQRRISLERELASESSTMAVEYAASQTRSRVDELQSQIDLLRLSYTDDYPDIIRLKQQIQELIANANNRPRQATDGTTSFSLNGSLYSGASNLSPVYQQLRSDLARVTAEAESQKSRSAQLQVMLEQEIKRSAVSGKVERELNELTRDYQINKDLYEDLLRRQESARLSMMLGAEKQGVLYRIQQPANFPVLPTGLRFIHIAGLGLLLALLLPIAYLVIFLKLDPRIRTQSAVTDLLELPLLTTVPHMKQPGEKAGLMGRPATVVGVVVLVVALYVIVAIAKYMIAISSQGAV